MEYEAIVIGACVATAVIGACVATAVSATRWQLAASSSRDDGVASLVSPKSQSRPVFSGARARAGRAGVV